MIQPYTNTQIFAFLRGGQDLKATHQFWKTVAHTPPLQAEVDNYQLLLQQARKKRMSLFLKKVQAFDRTLPPVLPARQEDR